MTIDVTITGKVFNAYGQLITGVQTVETQWGYSLIQAGNATLNNPAQRPTSNAPYAYDLTRTRTAAQFAAAPTAADLVLGGVFSLDTDPTLRYVINTAGTAFTQTAGGGGAVSSVAGKTGAVVLATADLTDGAALNAAVAANTAALSMQSDNAQTGTAYTLVLADAGQNVDMNNAAANTLTIPPHSAVAFPVGTIITVTMAGAGVTTIAAGAGVTIFKPAARSLAISAQYETAQLYQASQDTWRVLAG